jgi:hypothetical protein
VVTLTLVNAALGEGLSPAARAAMLLTWALPGFAVALLGLHYAFTLASRPVIAEGLYSAWLGVAIVASLMVPLLGWGILIGGLVHSSLQLPRWRRPEAEAA